MKLKNRMFAIMLALAMVVTYMPAMAFAEGEDEPAPSKSTEIEWEVDYDSEICLKNGSAELSISKYYYGEGEATYTYQWRKLGESGNYVDIEGATGSSYIASEAGYYGCNVTINVNGETDDKWIYGIDVASWRIPSYGEEIYVEYGKSVTLEAKTEYTNNKDEVLTFTYQWYKYEENETDPEGSEDDEPTGEYHEIPGATSASCIVDNVTGEEEYTCKVTAEGITKTASFYVHLDTSKYKEVSTYPNAEAEYQPVDNHELKIKYDVEGNINFVEWFKSGDIIKIKTNNEGDETETFTYNGEEDFVSQKDGEQIYIEDDLFLYDISSDKCTVHVYTKPVVDHVNKTITRKYDLQLDLAITAESHVESLSFEPNEITLNGNDCAVLDGNGDVLYYDLAFPRCFDNGDKLTITNTNGTSDVYIYNDNDGYGWFYKADGYGGVALQVPGEDKFLEYGENTVHVFFAGRSTTLKVFVTTHTHDYVEVEGSAKAATCTEKGKTADQKCSICGKVIAGSEIPTIDHKLTHFGAKAATASEEGNIEYWECSVCGKLFSDASGNNEITKEATVTPKNTAPITPVQPTQPAESESQQAADPVVTVGSTETVAGSTVKVTSDAANTVSFTKAKKNAKAVTVPATVKLSDGKTYKVTQIEANAFKGAKATTVTLGKNVKTLKAKAFNGSKVTTLKVKSKLLTKKSVKGSLKGSKVKTIQVKVGKNADNRKYVKTYKKIFTKANAGKKVTVK